MALAMTMRTPAVKSTTNKWPEGTRDVVGGATTYRPAARRPDQAVFSSSPLHEGHGNDPVFEVEAV